MLWAAGALLAARTQSAVAVLAMNAGDLARYGLWFAFLGSLLGALESGAQASAQASAQAPPRKGRATVIAPIVVALLV